MIPSVVYTIADRRVTVVYRWSISCKRDALGRRIRGTTRYDKLLGYTVKCAGMQDKQYPPETGARNAAKYFMEGE